MSKEKEQLSMRMRFERIAEIGLIIILITLTIFMMVDVGKIQGNARVVNYAGIIRGGTQRLIKLEITGHESDEMITYLDDIFSGLMHGGGKYQLTQIEDDTYNSKLNALYNYWGNLKNEIDVVREKGYKQTNIIAMSEAYFEMADETVGAAESYSHKYAARLKNIETAIIVVIVILIVIVIHQMTEQVLLRKKAKELGQKAYTDLPTGLPNKSRCEELLLNRTVLTDPTVVVIFDINGLKEVNDTLGHTAGDTLIANFAQTVRTSIPSQHFVGRYGGDEFIAILYHTNKEEAEKILENVQHAVDHFNEYSNQTYLEYAHGYAVSTDYSESTLKILLEKADKNMYLRKAAMKGKYRVR